MEVLMFFLQNVSEAAVKKAMDLAPQLMALWKPYWRGGRDKKGYFIE